MSVLICTYLLSLINILDFKTQYNHGINTMEPDRYNNNNRIYIIGIICLVIAITFFFFSMYIAPFMIWNLKYDVPELITSLITLFHENYEYSLGVSKIIVWLIFFIPCLITGFVSYYISNYIDNKIYNLDIKTNAEEEKTKISPDTIRKIKESASIGGKIILLMIAIVFIIFLLHEVIQLT